MIIPESIAFLGCLGSQLGQVANPEDFCYFSDLQVPKIEMFQSYLLVFSQPLKPEKQHSLSPFALKPSCH